MNALVPMYMLTDWRNVPVSSLPAVTQAPSPKPSLLLPRSALHHKPVPAFDVERVLKQQSVAVMFGEPGSGKTFLALDLALSIATGTDWLGHNTKPGCSVFIGLEGQPALRDRVDAWEAKRGIAADDEAFVFYGNSAINLVAESDVEDLISAIQDITSLPVKLVVIDTLTKAFEGDDNSSADMSKLLKAARQIVAATGANVLFLHHPPDSNKNKPRGSTALLGDVDTSIQVTRNGKIGTIKVGKVRDGEGDFSFGFELQHVTFFRNDGTQGKSLVPMLVTGTLPKTGKASPAQTAQNADRLTVLLSVRIGNDRRTVNADGLTVFRGTQEDLKAAMASLQAELSEGPENAGKKPDSLRRQCDRARDELVSQGKLTKQGEEWVLSL